MEERHSTETRALRLLRADEGAVTVRRKGRTQQATLVMEEGLGSEQRALSRHSKTLTFSKKKNSLLNSYSSDYT